MQKVVRSLVILILIGLLLPMPAFADNGAQKPLVIILLGPPGSGKGTQAQDLSANLNLPHISTGNLFRENIKNKTPLGLQAQRYIDAGQLGPDSLAFEILFNRTSQSDCRNGYILDGFPRTLAQAEELQRRLSGTAHIVIFNLVVSDETIIHRLEGRLTCGQCHRLYHLQNSPPRTANICDNCGGELHRRSDDNPEVIRERLKVYHEQTRPVEGFYMQLGMLNNVDASFGSANVTDQILTQLSTLTGKETE